jgi:hypothetical protein
MSERSELYNFVKAWGDKTERVLKGSAQRYRVKETGSLLSSISGATTQTAKGISFELSFDTSGRFVDMGAGRGASKEERRASRRGRYSRKPKKWYGPAFYSRLNPLESGLGFQIMEAATDKINSISK